MKTRGRADDWLAFQTTLPALKTLNLGHTAGLTDAGLFHLAELIRRTKPEHVILSPAPNITAAGLAHLVGCPHLTELFLSEAPGLGDDALEILARMTWLEELGIQKAGRISDFGLRHLYTLTKLRELRLYLQPVSTLGRLFGYHGVSAAGLQALRQALPGCRVL